MIGNWHRVVPAALALLAAPLPAHAQEATAAAEDDAQEDIVVVARRSGAPMWEVDTPGGKLLLVGEIIQVPKAAKWVPDRLERATLRADRVVLGVKATFSVGDVFKVLFAGGAIRKLPKGHTAADYLSPEELADLRAIETKYGQDYETKSLLITAFDILTKRLKFNDDTADDASKVVRRAADRARIPSEPVGVVRGKDLLTSLFEAPPASHRPCLVAAIAALDGGPEAVRARADDWTEFRVPAVLRSPLERALGSCWPWTDPTIGPELLDQWTVAVDHALHASGVTLAVVPLRVLGEDGGLLDSLAACRLAIKGPAWREADAPAPAVPCPDAFDVRHPS